MPRRAVTTALIHLSLCAVAVAATLPAVVARAQGAAAPTATAAPTAAASAAPAASDAPPATPPHPATGYGYSDPKPRKVPARSPSHLTVHSGVRPAHPHPAPQRHAGPVATLPGFQMLGEGGSRLFVELSQTVPVEERKGRGVLTYVLKGAHVELRNNRNALVTVHFNTPVTRARLVPSGHDLLFVVDLRANVAPTWKVNPGKDGASVLVIDFPKGTYVH
jgi:hypothetical protein